MCQIKPIPNLKFCHCVPNHKYIHKPLLHNPTTNFVLLHQRILLRFYPSPKCFITFPLRTHSAIRLQYSFIFYYIAIIKPCQLLSTNSKKPRYFNSHIQVTSYSINAFLLSCSAVTFLISCLWKVYFSYETIKLPKLKKGGTLLWNDSL